MQGPKHSRPKVAEAKLIVMSVYLAMLAFSSLPLNLFTKSAGTENMFADLISYFSCESVGKDAGRDCTSLLLEVQEPYLIDFFVGVTIVTWISPAVVLLYSTDCKN